MTTPKKIILIDDNEADNFLHKFTIEASELCKSVLIFEYAELALEYLKTTEAQIDFIFTDINMPRMSGLELLQALKNIEHKSANPTIIMLSTSIDPDDCAEAVKLGASECINKHLKTEAFEAIVKKYDQ